MDVKMILKNGKDAKWKFGSCSGPTQLQRQKQYLLKCCMAEKDAILTCQGMMQWGSGWNDGLLEIEGHKFCDVFFNEIMIRLNIQGKSITSSEYEKFALIRYFYFI